MNLIDLSINYYYLFFNFSFKLWKSLGSCNWKLTKFDQRGANKNQDTVESSYTNTDAQ